MTARDSPPGHAFVPGGNLRLPTPPGVARRFWTRHPRLTDSLVAAVYAVPSLVALLVQRGVAGRDLPLVLADVAVVAIVTAAIVVRRRWPVLVLGVTAIALLSPAFGDTPGDVLPVLIALHSVAVYRSARSAWIGLAAAAGLGFLGALLWPSPFQDSRSVATLAAVMMLAATLVGVNVGDRKRYVLALLDLAGQLAEERDRQAQLARVSERARIAREMHDIVAHSLSVMVALADGSDAIAPVDPERARAAMREVAGVGRSSMHEMRRLLGILAEDPGTDAPSASLGGPLDAPQPLRPQPGTAQLADLVQTFRAAGLPARLELQGHPPSNPGVQLTIYRVVQESLTNALRYAEHPTRVTVRLVTSPGEVELTIADNGRPRPAVLSQGSGRGIIGLGERVALYGGTLEAAASPLDGWRVHATMIFQEEDA